MKRVGWLLLVVAFPGCREGVRTDPGGPISYRHEQRKDPPQRFHIVTIDLTDPRVSIVVRPGGADPDGEGRWQTTLMTTSAIAERDDLDVAINGDFFAAKEKRSYLGVETAFFEGNPAYVLGHGMTDGVLWAEPTRISGSLIITDENQALIVPNQGPLPKNARQAIGGSKVLVDEGKLPAAPTEIKESDRAPRTAVGVNRSGTKLIFFVADGRQPEHAAGLTAYELAKEMARYGAYRAINLDGGGSTTMVIKGASGARSVVNQISDWRERPVANVLGVKVRAGASRQ